MYHVVLTLSGAAWCFAGVKLKEKFMAFAYARELPNLAFWWEQSQDGADFLRLENDLKAAGGTIERVDDSTVSVSVAGRQFAMKIGFAAVLENGIVRQMPLEEFRRSFDVMTDTMIDIEGRLLKVEAALHPVEHALIALDTLAGRVASVEKNVDDVRRQAFQASAAAASAGRGAKKGSE